MPEREAHSVLRLRRGKNFEDQEYAFVHLMRAEFDIRGQFLAGVKIADEVPITLIDDSAMMGMEVSESYFTVAAIGLLNEEITSGLVLHGARVPDALARLIERICHEVKVIIAEMSHPDLVTVS